MSFAKCTDCSTEVSDRASLRAARPIPFPAGRYIYREICI